MPQTTWLLDTNILLASTIEPERLSAEVRQSIADTRNLVYFSAASIWEIAIKRSLNRASFDFMPEDIHRLALETGFTELPVRSGHCYELARMPWHHRDPFDRLLVAQALVLPAYLLTADEAMLQYSDLVRRVTLT